MMQPLVTADRVLMEGESAPALTAIRVHCRVRIDTSASMKLMIRRKTRKCRFEARLRVFSKMRRAHGRSSAFGAARLITHTPSTTSARAAGTCQRNRAALSPSHQAERRVPKRGMEHL